MAVQSQQARSDGDVQWHVLVVGGNAARVRGMTSLLETIGFWVSAIDELPSAIESFKSVVLDCVELDGPIVASRRLRRSGWQGGLVAVVPHVTATMRTRLLEAGVDQVVSDPFAPRDLLACVWATSRRASTTAASTHSSSDDETPPSDRLHVGTQLLGVVASAARLTDTERSLLKVLCRSTCPVPALDLLLRVFGRARYAPNSSHLRVHLHRLRSKLRPLGFGVVGVRNRGYRLEELSSCTRTKEAE